MNGTMPAGRRRADTTPGVYRGHPGDVFLPGAGNWVFEPRFGLPPIQLIGAAIYAGRAPSPVQRQIIRTVHATTTAGLGGLVAGQMITQPLNTPDSGFGGQ